jgi:hypothetical protein
MNFCISVIFCPTGSDKTTSKVWFVRRHLLHLSGERNLASTVIGAMHIRPAREDKGYIGTSNRIMGSRKLLASSLFIGPLPFAPLFFHFFLAPIVKV